MQDAAAVMGCLTDARNIAAHKCLRLTIEVPAERAMEVFKAFGWPTAVDPVPVAIARLVSVSNEAQEETAPAPAPTIPRAPSERAHKSFDDLTAAQQAGISCQDPRFQRYLAERHECRTDAADYVRSYCGVASRAELQTNPKAHHRWRLMLVDYRAWEMAPSVGVDDLCGNE